MVFGQPLVPEVPGSEPSLGAGTGLISASLYGNGSGPSYIHTDLGKHILNSFPISTRDDPVLSLNGSEEINQEKSLTSLIRFTFHFLFLPTMARLARKILCVPASSVSCESAFSISGRALENRWTSGDGQRQRITIPQQQLVGEK